MKLKTQRRLFPMIRQVLPGRHAMLGLMILFHPLMMMACVADFSDNGVVPNDYDKWAYQEARKLYDAKEYDAAAEAFQAQLDQYPKGDHAPNAHYYLGRIQFVRGDMPGAREKFLLVIKNYPDHDYMDNAQFWAGRTYFEEENYTEALPYFQKVIDLKGFYLDGAWFYRARCKFELGEIAAALADLQTLMADFPDSSYRDNAQYWIGRLYLAQADFATAISEFQKVLDQYPDSFYRDSAQYYIGFTYEEQGDALTLAGDSAGAGSAYDAAVVAYQALVSGYPDSSFVDNAQYHIGRVRLTQGDFTAARAELQKVLDLYPGSFYEPAAQYYIGFAYEEEGRALQAAVLPGAATQFANARAAYLQFLTKYPTDGYADNAQYHLGRMELELANYGAARTELQKVLTLYPGSFYEPAAQYYIGFAHEEEANVLLLAADPAAATQFAAARTAYQLLLSTYLQSSYGDNAQYHIARTYHDQQDCVNEKSAMQVVLDKFPTSFYAGYATNHIASINAGGHTCL